MAQPHTELATSLIITELLMFVYRCAWCSNSKNNRMTNLTFSILVITITIILVIISYKKI